MSEQYKIEMRSPKRLNPNPWNTNVVSPDNEAKIEESIKRLGMFKPILVREVDGELEILGGEHRALVAERMGIAEVPVINLGEISDQKAKEISLVDNGRYGSDDTLQLAELLEQLGSPDDLAKFMPYSDTELASIFSSVNIALDDLDLPDLDESPSLPKERPIQTSQVLRFKVPVEDVALITELIEKTMKVQKFTESDSLSNAGDALVYLLNKAPK
jgi:ParB-like chromosome segregation protein Spo0J